MRFTCEICFPYNWSREFYCGEKLHLSVELKCHQEAVVEGVTLIVSSPSQNREKQSCEYSHYIDDRDSLSRSSVSQDTFSDHKTEIDLISGRGMPIALAAGTYIFNLECFLPDMTIEQSHDECNETDFNFSVKIKKFLNLEFSRQNLMLVHQLMMRDFKKEITFVWPGEFAHIANFSIVSATISCFYVANSEDRNNREGSSETKEENDSLENWLDCILGRPESTEDSEEDT